MIGRSQSASRPLDLLALTALIYLVVSGGAYGIEDAVRIAGPRLTLLLCMVIPLTLSLPTALMAAELTALIPREGGFYFWVKEGLGPFAGFAEAYLTLLFTLVDTTLYPVLFATYVSFLIPLTVHGQVILGVALVWGSGLLNLFGTRMVGRASITFTLAVLAPFAVLVVLGLPRLIHWQAPLQPLAGPAFLTALGGGLTIVMWNFSGWENVSVVAGEIATPRRSYLRAITIALPLVTLGYLLPLGVALSGVKSVTLWRAGYFAAVGLHLGGPILGIAIGLGGALSAFAMFTAAIFWVSRLPFILAIEGYLPRELTVVTATQQIPARSILICCAIFTLLVPLGFITLLVFDVFFYMLALILELAALVSLRRLRPHREGLFVIGGGRAGLYAVVAAPMLTWAATFAFAAAAQGGRQDFIVALLLAGSVWPAYALLRHHYGRPYGGPTSS